jgi:hypothetical protein
MKNSESDLALLVPVVSTTMPFNFYCPEQPKVVYLASPRSDDIMVTWKGIGGCTESTTYSKFDASRCLLRNKWIVINDPAIIRL